MDQFALLPDDAVIKLPFAHPLTGHPMFTAAEFSKAGLNQVNSVHKNQNSAVPNCEILVPGMDWKKGKYRIKVIVEFCPDENPS